MTNAPADFRDFVLGFDPRNVKSATDLDVWIATYILSFSAPQRGVVKSYLDELLNNGATDAELEKVWMMDGPTFGASKGGYRAFLQLVRSRF